METGSFQWCSIWTNWKYR